MTGSADIMSVFRRWQIICYLCGRFGHNTPPEYVDKYNYRFHHSIRAW